MSSELGGILGGLLAKQGCDPGLVAALQNNRGGWGGMESMLPLLVLLLLFGRRGFDGEDGGRERGCEREIHREARFTDARISESANFERICSMIEQNREAIASVAREIGVEARATDNAICQVKTMIASNGNDMRATFNDCCCKLQAEILNSRFETEKGFCATQHLIDKCCCETNRHLDKIDCDIKTRALETDFLIEKKFCATDAKIDKCCCETEALIERKFCDQNFFLERKFDEIRSREADAKIEKLENALAESKAREREETLLRAIREGREFDRERDRDREKK